MSSLDESIEDNSSHSSTCSLKHQIEELRYEKKVLLDHLAMSDVTLCVGCDKKLPMLEECLDSNTKRKLTKLQELREKSIRVNDEYHTERKSLTQLQKKLSSIIEKSKTIKFEIENKSTENDLLQNSLDDIRKEGDKLANLNKEESEKLKSLQREMEHIQNEYQFEGIKRERDHKFNERGKIKSELDDLRCERNSLDNEIFAISEYMKLKSVELENHKKTLKDLRQEADETNKAVRTAEEERRILNAKTDVLRYEITIAESELRRANAQISNTKQSIKEATEEKEKLEHENSTLGDEVTTLAEGTKRFRSVLEDYRIQRANVEHEFEQLGNELSIAMWQLENTRTQLNEAITENEVIETQRKETFKLHESHRAQMRERLIASKKNLNGLRENLDQIKLEIQTIKPVIRQKMEMLNENKKHLQKINEHCQEIESEKQKKIMLLNSVSEEKGNLKTEPQKEETKLKFENIKIENQELQDSQEKINNEIGENNISHDTKILMENILRQFYQECVNERKFQTDHTTIDELISELQNYFKKYLIEHYEQPHIDSHQLSQENMDVNLKEIENIQDEIVKLRNRSFALKEERDDLHSLLKNLEQSIEDAKKRCAELEENLSEDTRRYENLVHEKKEMTDEVTNTQEEYHRICDELQTCNEDATTKKAQLEKLQNELRKLDTSIQKLQQEIIHQQNKRSQLINAVNQARIEIIDLQRSNSLSELARRATNGEHDRNLFPRFDDHSQSL